MKNKNYALTTRDVKKSFKMWKKKKNWVYGAILFLGSGAVMSVNTGNVRADEMNQSTPVVPSALTHNADTTTANQSNAKTATDSPEATASEVTKPSSTNVNTNTDTSVSANTNANLSANANVSPGADTNSSTDTNVSTSVNTNSSTNANVSPDADTNSSTDTNVSTSVNTNSSANANVSASIDASTGPSVTPETIGNTGINTNENTATSASGNLNADTNGNEGTNVTATTVTNTGTTLNSNMNTALATKAEVVPTASINSPTADTTNTGDLNKRFSNWTETNFSNAIATGSFTANGSNYEVTMKGTDGQVPLEANTIKKTTEDVTHTYSFSEGSAATSHYYTNSNGVMVFLGATSDERYYISTNGAGNDILAHVGSNGSYQIAETVQVTQNGEIQHNVTIRNKSSVAISGLNAVGVILDTMLDSDDRIPIYSDGAGGIYIQNDGITLYCSPGDNSSVLAGQWGGNNRSQYVPATGGLGTILKNGVDTQILYEAPVTTLAPDQSVTFSFAERVLVNTKIMEHFVDVAGKTIAPDDVVGGQLGQTYTITPISVPGYKYQSTTGDLTGTFSLKDKEITSIYKAIDYTLKTAYTDDAGNAIAPTVNDTTVYHIGDAYQAHSKTFAGYELIATPKNAVGNFGTENITVTYVYKKTAQSIMVVYIDDATQTSIKTDRFTGKSGEVANYSTTATVDELQSNGYRLVSDGVPANLTFSTDKTVNQRYDVHFTHNTKSSTKKTTRTIHYVVSDGSTQAPADVVQEITWAIDTDLVTGKSVATPQAIYQAVDSPELMATNDTDGKQLSYIPVEPTIAEQDFAPTTDLTSLKDSNLTVTYDTAIAGKGIKVEEIADQNISIVYIDDATQTSIKTDQFTGKSGEVANYSTTATVDELQSNGYRLVSDGVPVNLVFDTDTTVDQVYDVHFTHNTKSSTKKTTRTIHYVVSDGSTQAPADVVQEITWAIDTDLVTGKSVATPQAIYQAVDSPELMATNDTDGKQLSYIPVEPTIAEQDFAPTTDLTSLKDSNLTVTYYTAIVDKGIHVYTKVAVPPAVFVEKSSSNPVVPPAKKVVPTKTIIDQPKQQTMGVAKNVQEKQTGVTSLGISVQNASTKGNNTLANATLKTNEANQEKAYPKTGETKSNLSLIGLLTIGLSSIMFLIKKNLKINHND